MCDALRHVVDPVPVQLHAQAEAHRHVLVAVGVHGERAAFEALRIDRMERFAPAAVRNRFRHVQVCALQQRLADAVDFQVEAEQVGYPDRLTQLGRSLQRHRVHRPRRKDA